MTAALHWNGARYALLDNCVIGRRPSCDIVVRHNGVSRCHTRVRRLFGEFRVSDLGSRHGTWVNGERLKLVDEVPLQNGDELRVGRVTFRFMQQSEIEWDDRSSVRKRLYLPEGESQPPEQHRAKAVGDNDTLDTFFSRNGR